MTAVKICGVRDLQVLELLAELKADYAGLVFAESRRRIEPRAAAELVRQVPRHPRLVGVFVNPSPAELNEVLSQVPLSVVQLHGQEPPELCRQVKDAWGVSVWKAISVGEDGTPGLSPAAYADCVDAVLFDTRHPVLAGGTGQRFSWSALPRLRRMAGAVPLVVAGGVSEANVAELITAYRPYAVDVSSGVETDGAKDPQKIRRFLERVRACDADLISRHGET